MSSRDGDGDSGSVDTTDTELDALFAEDGMAREWAARVEERAQVYEIALTPDAAKALRAALSEHGSAAKLGPEALAGEHIPWRAAYDGGMTPFQLQAELKRIEESCARMRYQAPSMDARECQRVEEIVLEMTASLDGIRGDPHQNVDLRNMIIAYAVSFTLHIADFRSEGLLSDLPMMVEEVVERLVRFARTLSKSAEQALSESSDDVRSAVQRYLEALSQPLSPRAVRSGRLQWNEQDKARRAFILLLTDVLERRDASVTKKRGRTRSQTRRYTLEAFARWVRKQLPRIAERNKVALSPQDR